MKRLSTICLLVIITALLKRIALSEPDSRRLKRKETDKEKKLREATEKKIAMKRREEDHKRRIESWNEDKHSFDSPDIAKVCYFYMSNIFFILYKLT